MLKHRGVCRAAGGEKPPKSEGGGSETPRAGAGAGGLGSGPEVEVFAAKNFTLRPDPGAAL